MGHTGLCRGAVPSTAQVCKMNLYLFSIFYSYNINKSVWQFNLHSGTALKIWICYHCYLMAYTDFLNQHTFLLPLRALSSSSTSGLRPSNRLINSLPRRAVLLYLNIVDTKFSKSSLYLNSYWLALTSRLLFRNICSIDLYANTPANVAWPATSRDCLGKIA